MHKKRLFAAVLAGAGVAVQLEDVPGTFHGFDVFRNTAGTKQRIARRAAVLHRVFWSEKFTQEEMCRAFAKTKTVRR